jgi:hypothetical protein
MMDEDMQVLKILSDTADNIYRTKRSNIARIENSGFTQEAKDTLMENIVGPLDESIKYITVQIFSSLNKIPIYNYFLCNVEGMNIFDIAQLICIIKDINNFPHFANLMSYAGFIPKPKKYNQNLHKLLLRIAYKLIKRNPQYKFVFDINCEKYREKYPRRTDKHIENLAKRIVIKRFLKNLYFSWTKINNDF